MQLDDLIPALAGPVLVRRAFLGDHAHYRSRGHSEPVRELTGRHGTALTTGLLRHDVPS
ncbi:hypothetical protein NKH18_00900 [Streptomyces sp. M10(2022)]